MYCKYCSKELKEGTTVCEHCGKKQIEIQELGKSFYKKFLAEKKKRPVNHVVSGIVDIVVGIVMFAIRSSIKSDLYRSSVRNGWAGQYNEPFIVTLLMILGIIAIVLGLYELFLHMKKNS